MIHQPTDDEILWFVAHTKPRCEKKLVGFCQREGLSTTLPTYKSVKKYRGKTVVFNKPLFPGYVFLQMIQDHRRTVYQSDYCANLLDVPDQETFKVQLSDILFALEADIEVRLAPTIREGERVRIKSGALRGMEGWVEKRVGVVEVMLRLDFIGQAASVRMSADELETT